MSDTIREGSQVAFHYTLHAAGELVETSSGAAPLTYTHGQNMIVPGLEAKLEGMAVGDRKDVHVAPEEAYGEHHAEAVRKLPRANFAGAGELSVGDRVAGHTEGREVHATVTAVDDETITLDFNHPLAGKDLAFSVEIVEVK